MNPIRPFLSSLMAAAVMAPLAAGQDSAGARVRVTIPDIEVVTQDGTKARFFEDLVKGKSVVVNFIFTTCTTICPVMGANFARLQKQLGARAGRDIHLISVSVDPVNDTPARLTEWRGRFANLPGWTLVTGSKPDIDRLLRGLGAYTADKLDHAPLALIGNEPTGNWTRANAMAPPERLAEIVLQLHQPTPAEPPVANADALRYFTDVKLIDQNGQELRFYSDLLKGRTVIINSIFTECKEACPVLTRNFSRIQQALGDRLGKAAFMLSFSVDPENDTPERLAEYAKRMNAKPGWYFLTGTKENVNRALAKLGLQVQTREQHSNIFLIGNERTGLWKKVFGMARPEEIERSVESVLNDRAPAAR